MLRPRSQGLPDFPRTALRKFEKDGTSPKSNKVLCHGVLVGIPEVFIVAGEGVLGSTGAALSSQMAMQGHRRACGRRVHSEEKRGYIRVHSGTFGYIRVHSGTLRPFQTFEKPPRKAVIPGIHAILSGYIRRNHPSLL